MREIAREASLEEIAPEALERVKEAAQDGRISCGVARRIAGELGVPVRIVGRAADALGVKIFACELGCF